MPGFLSKLVKPSNSPSHSREGSRRSFDSIIRGRTPSPTPSKLANPTTTAVPSIVLNDALQAPAAHRGRDPSIAPTTRSSSPASTNQPIVTIVPPSPRSTSRSGWSNSSEDGGTRHDSDSERQSEPPKDSKEAAPTITVQAPSPAEDTNKPTAPAPLTGAHSRTLTPASSTGNLRELVQQHANHAPPPPSPSARTLELPSLLRRKSSNRSIKVSPPPPISISPSRSATSPPATLPARSVTDSSATAASESTATITSTVLDSPTSLVSSSPFTDPSTATLPTSARVADSDTASIHSGISAPTHLASPQVPTKKRSWRRGSTPSRKPTALAGAIAASGMTMAMANASMAVPQITLQQQSMKSGTTKTTNRKSSGQSALGLTMKPAARTPSSSSRKTRSRRTSTSVGASPGSENNSEIYLDDREYSGLEDSSSSGGSDSSDDLAGLDFGENDIPVTGFAVASSKRNADFHDLFPNIPEGDYLIEDYGCALQREILIQGRLYISENHICFHSNIFGWVTDLSIPVSEITTLEKKMTAYVIPNAIQITTPRSKSTFSSLLARDTTYDVIHNVWRLARPEDTVSLIGSPPPSTRGSLDEGGRRAMDEARPVNGVVVTVQNPMILARRATQCECGRTGGHLAETAIETVLPGTPDRIHNLIFASGFMKDFMKDDQRLLDIQISDWSPVGNNPVLLARNMSYIRPLTASIGPKQTKCEIRDETLHCDFDDYIVMLTTTRTPDVPSGGVFAVKTRTCIMWASGVSTRLIITTQVDWTGRSFIKGIIEKSAIEGQKTYHVQLEKAMRAYIQEHQVEFLPAGVDLPSGAVVAPSALPNQPRNDKTAPTAAAALAALTAAAAASAEGEVPGAGDDGDEQRKQREREHERNLRGLQWAYDTFEGASQVARQSARGALELVAETWEQSTSTSICIAIIILLVFSNLYTLFRMGGREEAGRLKEKRRMEEKEKWVQGIVTALWDELAAGRGGPAISDSSSAGLSPFNVAVPQNINWREEIAGLSKSLDTIEERVRLLRDSLNSLD